MMGEAPVIIPKNRRASQGAITRRSEAANDSGHRSSWPRCSIAGKNRTPQDSNLQPPVP